MINDDFFQTTNSIQQVNGEVILGDACDVLKTVDSNSVSCIVTDPPYGIAYHSNYYKEKNPHAPIAQDWNFQISSYLREATRVLCEGGAIYLFTRWDVLPLWAKEIPTELAFKNTIIWAKDNWSSGDLTGNFGFQYEMLMFLVKGRHTIRGKRWSNIWEFPRIPSKRLRMPAEKPVGLYERAILSSSDPEDIVIDTFCGSGTCAEAAVKTGRRFIVSDIDRNMVQMTRNRIGLSGLDIPEQRKPIIPSCPILNIIPPEVSLWGLHPEDISTWIKERQ